MFRESVSYRQIVRLIGLATVVATTAETVVYHTVHLHPMSVTTTSKAGFLYDAMP